MTPFHRLIFVSMLCLASGAGAAELKMVADSAESLHAACGGLGGELSAEPKAFSGNLLTREDWGEQISMAVGNCRLASLGNTGQVELAAIAPMQSSFLLVSSWSFAQTQLDELKAKLDASCAEALGEGARIEGVTTARLRSDAWADTFKNYSLIARGLCKK